MCVGYIQILCLLCKGLEQPSSRGGGGGPGSCVLSLLRDKCTVLNIRGKSGYPCLIPDFRGLSLSMMLTVDFSYVAFICSCSVTWSRLTLATLWTVALQSPLSMGFSGKITGVGCHILFIASSQPTHWPHVSCITSGFFTTEPPGNAEVIVLFLESWEFYHERTLNFVKCLFCISRDDHVFLSFVLCGVLYWLSYVDSSLYLGDKSNLVIVYDLLIGF